MVNVVFVSVAVLAQLFLSSPYGNALSAWVASQKSFVKGEKAGYKLETERRRLLSAGASGGSQLYSDGSSVPNESQATMPSEHPSALYVELSDAHHLLHQHNNLQSDDHES